GWFEARLLDILAAIIEGAVGVEALPAGFTRFGLADVEGVVEEDVVGQQDSAVCVLSTDHDGPALIVGVVVGEGVVEQMEIPQVDSHRAALADVVEASRGAIGLQRIVGELATAENVQPDSPTLPPRTVVVEGVVGD